MKDYKELIVWQKSIDLVIDVYKVTKQLPSEEKYGICSQIRNAVVSIPSNIAEGSGRNNSGEFNHFLGIAYGSSTELETQLIIVKRLYSIDVSMVEALNTEIQKMLNGLQASIKTNH